MTDRIQNVVLVVVDALRRDRVSAYEQGYDLTPNLASLASDGTVFENAFACTNATDPSMTSIHTGRDPDTVVKHHGPLVSDEEKQVAESVTTVPETLQSAGVSTVATGRPLGRWHTHGFDQFPTETVDRYERRAMGERLEAISPHLRTFAGAVYDRIAKLRSSDDSDEISEFLDTIDDGPFYGLVHLMDTHIPYDHDEALVDEFLDRHDYPNRDLDAFFEEHEDSYYVTDVLKQHVDEADYRDGLARLFATYDASVRHADEKVGRLVEGLRRRGLADETAIVVTSDHGESLDEHGIYFDHHGLYEPTIRVPMIVAGPTDAAPRREEFVQLYDLAPTTLDLFGVDASLDCDGRSFAPLLGGDGTWDDRDHVVVQEAHAQRRLGIRTADHKYIKHVEDEVLERERGDSFRCGYCNTVHGDRQELYDLGDDPGETTDLVEDRPELAADLEAELTAYFDGLDYPEGVSGAVEYETEEAVLDRLEDLGYR